MAGFSNINFFHDDFGTDFMLCEYLRYSPMSAWKMLCEFRNSEILFSLQHLLELRILDMEKESIDILDFLEVSTVKLIGFLLPYFCLTLAFLADLEGKLGRNSATSSTISLQNLFKTGFQGAKIKR